MVDKTAVIDPLVAPAWARLSNWVDVFVAIGGVHADAEGYAHAYRQYPGGVGSLNSSGGVRVYDAARRGWFQSAVARCRAGIEANQKSRAAAQRPSDGARFAPHAPSLGRANSPAITRADYVPPPTVQISGPYLDAFGRGFLISEFVLMRTMSGATLGVAGVDLLASVRPRRHSNGRPGQTAVAACR